MAAPKKSNKKRKPARRKSCPMCVQGLEYVDYKDLATLKQFINERSKIKARRTSGACARHQKELTAAVKNAREMALIPYASR